MTEMRVRDDLIARPLSGTIGAVIEGVDLREVTDAEVAAIRRIWLERKVVFFPSQHLDPDSHLAFAARFGDLTEGHPVIPGIEGNPKIFQIDYSDDREVYASYGDAAKTAGLDWHTDVTFVRRPPMGSILSAVTIPPSGGDTMFSDQAAAFAAAMLMRGTTVHTLRPDSGACSSTLPSPSASPSSSSARVRRCWPSSTAMRCAQSSPSATTGRPAMSAFGTTEPPSMRSSATIGTRRG